MILVLTPLAIEIHALRAALGTPQRTERIGDFEVTTHGRIACAVGGHGKVRFALSTQFLAGKLHPELVVCAGACGALDPSLAAGDLVVAEKTVEHDFHLKFVQRPPPAFAGDDAALARLRGMPGLRFGVIASGDEDIVDSKRAEELRLRTGALAVAWEGAGLARAAEFLGLSHLEVRAVTDSANEHALKDFKKNVDFGMSKIAKVLETLAL
jgi:adenosylhomocysteine nucleosidase